MENSEKKPNVKLYRRLRKAYCRVHEKEKDKISVTYLTEEADVSRATFYLYFKNIEEFEDYITDYIISLYVKQLLLFLDGGREKAKELTKRSSLIFTDDDFKLLSTFFGDVHIYGFESRIYKDAYNEAYKHIVPSVFSKRYIHRHRSRFELFLTGYFATMIHDFLDYKPEKTYHDLMRVFDLKDHIFPDLISKGQ